MGAILTLVILALIALGLFIVAIFVRDKFWALWGAGFSVVTVITWFALSYYQVATGHGGVPAAFGKIDVKGVIFSEGLNWKKPWETVYELSHQQMTFHRNASKGNAIVVQAKDNIPMNADVSFHWVLNYSAMGWIRQQYGQDYWNTLIIPSATSAVRTAGTKFEDWNQLMEQRESFRQKITSEFQTTVRAKMKVKGIPEDVIESAFSFPDVDLRKVLPVDEGLTREISLTKEAVQKGKRKVTEILNATLDARKRGQDGTAIRDTILRVFYSADSEGALPPGAKIPDNASLGEISQFILAIAEIKKAEAVEIAAEKGSLTVMVTGAGSNTALPLPPAK